MKAIGIDIGTTSVCGVLVDTDTGSVLNSVTKNSEAFIKTSNEWEKIQDTDKIITLATGILDCLIDDDVKVIGVCGQMHGIVYTDKDGNAVSNLYTWQDKRGELPYKDTTYANYLGSFSGYGNVTDFYNRQNGLVPDDAVSYCTIHDYLVMKLCGLKIPVIHPTNAASFGLYDIKSGKFDYDVKFEMCDGYKIVGNYKGIPVSLAIGDNQASVFSTLANDEDILLNVGTGSQVSIVSDRVAEGEGIEARPYFDNKYLIVGAALCGGRAYSLLKDFYKNLVNMFTDADDGKIYEVMNKLADSCDKLTLNVETLFAGTRLNPEKRASVTNLSEENFNPSQLTLGVLKGIADELNIMYNKMGEKKTGVVASGNGVRKNKTLVKVFEDTFGYTLKIPSHTEEAACGAVYYGMVAANVCEKNDLKKFIKYNQEA